MKQEANLIDVVRHLSMSCRTAGLPDRSWRLSL